MQLQQRVATGLHEGISFSRMSKFASVVNRPVNAVW